MQRFEYPAIGETMFGETLPNGLKLSVITKPGFSRCCAFFAADYGGADLRFRLGGEFVETPAGIAHFLEHKMFDMPEGNDAFAALAAGGAQPNAFTSPGMTSYYFESTDNFYENLRLLLSFVSTPYFTAESVAKEQGIIAQEIRMRRDDSFCVGYEELLRSLYKSHPVARSVIGTESDIAEISAETLYSCHKLFYRPCNMCLCVVGDVDPGMIRQEAMNILGPEAGEKPESDYGEAESLEPWRERFEKAMPVSAPEFFIGAKLPCPSRGGERLRARLLCGMALSYLYGRSSPFFTRNYESGLINDSFYVEHDLSAGAFTAILSGESEESEKVFRCVCAEAERAAEDGIDLQRFHRLKRASYGSRIRALNSFMGLCESMAEGAFEGYNCLESFKMMEDITAGELRRFIAENLIRPRFAMSLIKPLSPGKEVE